MRIIKRVDGKNIALEIIKLEDYPKYGLYQIYKIDNGKPIPLYKQTFTTAEILKVIDTKIIKEEVYV